MVVPTVDVKTLRELFRNLQWWETLYESQGLDVLTGPDGSQYHLADIQYLYSCRTMLSARQSQAIELCLYQDTKERDTTLIMGVSPTNPVAMYATDGLKKIIRLIESGSLPKYRPERAERESA